MDTSLSLCVACNKPQVSTVGTVETQGGRVSTAGRTLDTMKIILLLENICDCVVSVKIASCKLYLRDDPFDFRTLLAFFLCFLYGMSMHLNLTGICPCIY